MQTTEAPVTHESTPQEETPAMRRYLLEGIRNTEGRLPHTPRLMDRASENGYSRTVDVKGRGRELAEVCGYPGFFHEQITAAGRRAAFTGRQWTEMNHAHGNGDKFRDNTPKGTLNYLTSNGIAEQREDGHYLTDDGRFALGKTTISDRKAAARRAARTTPATTAAKAPPASVVETTPRPATAHTTPGPDVSHAARIIAAALLHAFYDDGRLTVTVIRPHRSAVSATATYNDSSDTKDFDPQSLTMVIDHLAQILDSPDDTAVITVTGAHGHGWAWGTEDNFRPLTPNEMLEVDPNWFTTEITQFPLSADPVHVPFYLSPRSISEFTRRGVAAP